MSADNETRKPDPAAGDDAETEKDDTEGHAMQGGPRPTGGPGIMQGGPRPTGGPGAMQGGPRPTGGPGVTGEDSSDTN